MNEEMPSKYPAWKWNLKNRPTVIKLANTVQSIRFSLKAAKSPTNSITVEIIDIIINAIDWFPIEYKRNQKKKNLWISFSEREV